MEIRQEAATAAHRRNLAKGFYLAATGGVLPECPEGAVPAAPGEGVPTVGKLADGSWDYNALNTKMKEIRTTFPNESKVIVAAIKTFNTRCWCQQLVMF